MQELHIILKYWWSVIGWPAIKEALPLANLKDKVMEVLVYLVAAILFIAVVGRANSSLQVSINDNPFIFVLGATFVLRLIAKLIYLPAKIYSDQGGFIDNPFEITPISYPSYDGTNQKWVGFEVKNRVKSANIKDCCLMLGKIVNLQTNERLDYGDLLRLLWSGMERDNMGLVAEYMTVQYGIPKRCDLAKTLPKQDLDLSIYTTSFGQHSERFLINPGKYRLTITATGTWRNQSINYSYLFDLSFQPEDNLQIEKVEEIAASP